MKKLPKIAKVWMWIAGVILFSVFIGHRIWYVSETKGYYAPRTADDWAAWGTWVAGLVTSAAFILTFHGLRTEQKIRHENEQRELRKITREAKLVNVFHHEFPSSTYFGKTGPGADPTVFQGTIVRITFQNDTHLKIRDISVGFETVFAEPSPRGVMPPIPMDKPPLYSVQRWEMTDDEEKAWYGRSKVSVLVAPYYRGESQTEGMQSICRRKLESEEQGSFDVVVHNTGVSTLPKWVKFEDGYGNRWTRRLDADSAPTLDDPA